MKKKVFISLPMHGKTETEIGVALKKTQDWYMSHEVSWDKDEEEPKIQFVDNFGYDPGVSPEDDFRKFRILCIAEAIRKMADCDVVVFVPGWDKACGCLVEYKIAEYYNIHKVIMDNKYE